jgi:hypothetical protein
VHKPDYLSPHAKLEAGYIRYIRILPTKGPDGEIRFETCIRRSQPDEDRDESRTPDTFIYSAISYSWGDPTLSHPVIVDEHKRMVAENLSHFLQRANMQRRHNGWFQGWLWVDALCIDQSDARERTHQVGIMSEIFGKADQVISWLGPAYDNSEHAMTAIAGHSDPYTSTHPILSQAELGEAICNLCERSYWKRLWVFQELRHAQRITLLCGAHTISWDQFRLLWRAIVDIAMTDEGTSERLKESLATRMITLRTKPMNFSLWNLLKETKTLECTDQRDRVFALLSVASDGHEGIEANYKLDSYHLAHITLQNKYATRPPKTLNEVTTDCEFLENVFRLPQGAMLRYQWHCRQAYRDESESLHYRGLRNVEQISHSLCVDIESSQGSLSWSLWAECHNHTAVAKLIYDHR